MSASALAPQTWCHADRSYRLHRWQTPRCLAQVLLCHSLLTQLAPLHLPSSLHVLPTFLY
jgi:hypothetical protein